MRLGRSACEKPGDCFVGDRGVDTVAQQASAEQAPITHIAVVRREIGQLLAAQPGDHALVPVDSVQCHDLDATLGKQRVVESGTIFRDNALGPVEQSKLLCEWQLLGVNDPKSKWPKPLFDFRFILKAMP